MPPEKRIALCRMIEKMEANQPLAQKLGLENRSTFQKQSINPVASPAVGADYNGGRKFSL